jgi:mono/diheme cytochrome c family protein
MTRSRNAIAVRFVVTTLLALSAGRAAAADYLAMSGKELYVRFCAACHGAEGLGDGPVAPSFTIQVPDLTLVARRQGGTFQRDRVERIVDGRSQIGAHGTRTMPVWGEDFSRAEIGNPNAEDITRTLITRLVDHVAEMQAAPPP